MTLERGLSRIVAALPTTLGLVTLGIIAWQGWPAINYHIEMHRFLNEASQFRVTFREYVARHGRPVCRVRSHGASGFGVPPENDFLTFLTEEEYFPDLKPLCDSNRIQQAADPVPPSMPLSRGPESQWWRWSLWTLGFLGLGITVVAASVPWGVFFVGRWIARGFARP